MIDPELRRRGPFADPVSPHPFLSSPIHRSGAFCGTCHDVSNPVFERAGPFDYAPAPLDEEPALVNSEILFPVERTYSEWLYSAFPNGVYAPEFAGNLPDGVVRTCQDCHLRDVAGRGCNDPLAPIRPDLPLHDMTGGNSWMPLLLDDLFPGEVDPAALAAGSARAVSLLGKAAELDLQVEAEADSYRARVTITNNTGHKLPTGYPEGRRMWLNLVAYDEADHPIYTSGGYDFATGELTHDEDLALYEAELGISPSLADALGATPGVSFHFVLNDSIYKDTRIPPIGFTNANYAIFGGVPVDSDHPGPRYADGQNWDAPLYPLPPATHHVIATLYYQTTSVDYVSFLRDENVTDTSGQFMYDLWSANGRAAPILMIADTTRAPSGIAENDAGARPRVTLGPNPFRHKLSLEVRLETPSPVRLEIGDLEGRVIYRAEYGVKSGARELTWNGCDDRGRQVGAGIYWVRLRAGSETFTRRAVRIE